MMASLVVRDLKKVYRKGLRGQAEALRGVSFSVEEGEAFGFIGPNGAGKSTTIKIVMGLGSASSGEVTLLGKSVTDPNARRGVGYVPENPYLFDYLSPLEILAMSLRLHGVKVDNLRQWSEYWLGRLGLQDVAAKPIRTFSKGMTQRVALAQALCIKPRLLILDEPLSGLDPVGRRDVVEILSEYKSSGGTLFFTSHVLHDVERIADRFGLIHQGTLRAVRSPSELAGEEEMVVVRSIGERVIPGMTGEPGGRWAVEVSRASLWNQLDVLHAAGHILVEVRPVLSLEHAFIKVVKGN